MKKNIKGLLVPIVLNIMFAAVSLYTLLVYHTQVADKDLLHFAYVAYTTMFANAALTFTNFARDDPFGELRILIDYAQLALALPCYATEMWLYYDFGANQVGVLITLFGLGAFFFFVLAEYKRQDLTDLALIISALSTVIVGATNSNFLAVAAALIYAGSYFFIKRKETCSLEPQGSYNMGVTLFGLVSLASLDPKGFVPEFYTVV